MNHIIRPKRAIRSFVLRAGRVSPRQQYALDHHLALYQTPSPEALWCLSDVFGREADVILEVGFGMGDSLLAQALTRPDVNYLGIEVHRAGIGSLVANAHSQAVRHLRIAPYDAVDVMAHAIPDGALQGIQVFFPDPWPKAKHQKRRLIQPDLIRQWVKKIKIGGFIHCATDWEDYAHQMHAVLSAEPALINEQQDGGFSPRPATRPLTKFEQRGTRLGHGVWDLIFVRRLA